MPKKDQPVEGAGTMHFMVVDRDLIQKHEPLVETLEREFPRITRKPGVMGGKPCIKGSRMTVGMIVSQIGEGASIEELMDDYPELKREDILEAIRYAGWYAGQLLLELDPAA